jgi:hypothetical protein
MACCLFATLYGCMPDYRIAVPTSHGTESSFDEPMALLWQHARAMQTGNVTMPFPTRSEADYLYRVANRVTLQGYRPATLWSNEDIAAVEQNGTWYTIDGE